MSSSRTSASATDRGSEHGFSLLELLPAIAIASLIVAGFTTFYLSEQRNFLQGRTDVGASQDLRAALDMTTRDLRMAGRNPHDATVGCGFTVATATQVQFTFDIDDNGVCGETAKGELRGFWRDGTDFKALVSPGAVDPWDVLATGVAATDVFAYWQDNAGTATATGLTDIRRVDVTLRVNRSAPIGTVSRRESATVLVRNSTL